jgi:phospholipid/cholesterol/gamma-HCH transport system substrate-binding protein
MPRTQNNLSLSKLRVGIFVLVALLVMGFLIINSTGEFNPFEKKLNLRARFATADGLRQNAEVQLAGVTIGKVEEVKFLPPDVGEREKIEARISIPEVVDGRPVNERIRTDSTAQLIALSLLSNDKIINITPGTGNGVPVQENDILNATTTMSINQLTQTGNDLLQRINELSVPATNILNKANNGDGTLGRLVNDESLYQNLDSAVAETRSTVVRLQTTLDKVNRGQGSAGKLLNDPSLYDSLNRSIGRIESISRDLRAGRGSAGKFLTDDALYNDTRAAVNDLRESMQSIRPALERLNKIAGDIDLITADISQGKGTAGKLLKDETLYEEARTGIARFNSTAARLDVLIGDAQDGKGTLGKLLTDEALYNNVNQTAGNINQLTSESTKLIYDFRQNPKKYLSIRFSIF